MQLIRRLHLVSSRSHFPGGAIVQGGRIKALLVQEAELAIRQKTGCITLDLLDQKASTVVFGLPAEEEAHEAPS